MGNKEKVISKLKGLKEFVVLQRCFDTTDYKQKYAMYDVEAKDEEEAWEEIQESIAINQSQEWLMTKEEAKFLAKFIADNVENLEEGK